jgi:hypothetical protein
MYTGMGINLGYSLTSKLNLVVGINYAVMNEVNVVILKQEHSMDEIIRIDTSLKFSAVDNRIGMKIDTVTTTNRFTSEDNLKLNTDKQLLAIPFCIQLHTSLRKVGLSIHAGATTFIFREITTILTNAGKPNEERTSESSNKLILAPTFGIGVHKNVYKSLDLHSSLSYQYLFSDQFANRNIFQFQAGLRYHF